MLNKIPGLMLIKDMNSIYLEGSDDTAKLFGYNKADDLVGLTDFDINCNAVVKAQSWIDQDNVVKATKKPLTVIDVERYASNIEKALVIHKDLIYNELGEETGIFCYCTELSTHHLATLNQTVSIHEPINAEPYSFQDVYPGFNLTAKESIVLFYTIRGYTAEGIAQKISRSRRTIEIHLENLKFKMNCPSKTALIEKAISLGFLGIIPNMVQ